jgi:hypothetical protein
MYDNYPPGAAHDPSAPYNQPVIPERDFDVEVTITMSKVVTITTDNYVPEYDDEDGHTYANTENTEWDKEFENSGHFTIADLIEELKGYVVEDMKTCAPNTGKGAHLQRLLLACEDWETIEESYEEQ